MDKVIPPNKNKVVHLQFGSSPSGNYTIRLHDALLEHGFDSFVLSLNSDVKGNPRIQNLGKKGLLIRKINQRLQDYVTRKKSKIHGAFTLSFMGSDVSSHPLVKEADYIYIHWVLGGFLSVKSLDKLANLGKPLIMVMHDMWSLTGGCSYSFDCEKFLTHCGKCPLLISRKENDVSYKQFEEKKKFYRKHDNIYLVSPSSWLFNLAKSAPLTQNKPVFQIPNPIDDTLFKPFDKHVAKKILNMENYDHIICFGANFINSPYKGWGYLKEALHNLRDKLSEKKIGVLVFGNASRQDLANEIPFDSKFMGFIRDDYTTNLIYNAADVFVAPSLADNLPTTIIESMCCGTPVVGFKTGGIPDIIEHGRNGYLADYKDAADFSKGIEYCLTNGLKGRLLPQFDKAIILEKHNDLFSFINHQA
ncbi:glycosyltransferase [Negadavirga shengliensis]|uniref:Glycosyltransferase n=1 Tax=Negadavirga shengliensis TaxID=1389218 RepID=A0ABV9T333_9BACT